MTDISKWIEAQLIFGRGQHFEPRGFDSSRTLLRLQLNGSFVASLINGASITTRFSIDGGPDTYSEMVRRIVAIAGEPGCNWFYVVDPDNALSILHSTNPYVSAHAPELQLELLERQPAKEGGCSHLGLAPADRSWLLLHDYDPSEELVISIHGTHTFCKLVAEKLNVPDQPDMA